MVPWLMSHYSWKFGHEKFQISHFKNIQLLVRLKVRKLYFGSHLYPKILKIASIEKFQLHGRNILHPAEYMNTRYLL